MALLCSHLKTFCPPPSQVLLAHGADPQLLSSCHGTPLHAAAAAGAGAAARLLLASGACPAAVWQGLTPAELAAHAGHLRTACLLAKATEVRRWWWWWCLWGGWVGGGGGKGPRGVDRVAVTWNRLPGVRFLLT